MKESGNSRKLEDRLLGDEWFDWQPGAGYEGIINAPRGLFIFFSSLALAGILFCIAGLWYLAYPRLTEFGQNAARFVGISALAASFLLVIWYLLQVFSAIFKLKFISARLAKQFPLRLLLPFSVRLAKFFRISRDKMSNSYLKFHNDLMYATRQGRNSKKFLLLLPRCLTSGVKAQINELCSKYRCRAFTAFGGDEARKIIQDNRPDAVIGVACERDLISGIQDIAGRIPVLAIVNRRPDGPCKNTLIDIGELDKILKFCSGI